MKNKLLALFFLLFWPSISYAEPYFTLKTGLVDMKSDTSLGYLLEAETGYNFNKHSIGLSFGNWQAKTDSGRLFVNPLMFQYKYNLNEKLSLGLGFGWGFIAFKEDYIGKAKADSSKIISPMIEYHFNNHWSLVLRYAAGDLKIESGSVEQGILEDYSRLDSGQAMIIYKF